MNQTELIEEIKANKQEIMVGLIIGLTMSIFALSCMAAYNYGLMVSCEKNGGLVALDSGECVYPMGKTFKTLNGDYNIDIQNG